MSGKNLERESHGRLADLEKAHLRRRLLSLRREPGVPVLVDESETRLVCFSSNDYLGLAQDERVREAASRAIADYGVGSGSSRLIAGTHPAHVKLEASLAAFKGVEAALSFSSGYAVAAGFASAFLDERSIVVLDKLCHACLIDAVRFSGARMRVFRHHDMDKLSRLLAWARREAPDGRIVVMTESVYSMDGDRAPLEAMADLADRHGALLLVDEAHAVGVLGPGGRGLGAALGLTDRIDFHMGTLGKALGVAGGYLAGSRAMVDVLLNRARSFIYSTAPPPCLAEAAGAALEVAAGAEGDRRRERVLGLVRRLAEGLGVPVPGAAILPFVIGDEEETLRRAAHLREAGFHVPAIRYPTVARKRARLRLSLSALHTDAQMDSLIEAIQAGDSGRRPSG